MSNSSFISQAAPRTLKAGATYSMLVCMQNTGSDTWTSGGANPYRLGDVPHDTGVFITPIGSGHRTELPGLASVAPSGYATFTVVFTAPTTAGTYTMQWQMLQEGIAWFGATTTSLTITVNAGRTHVRSMNSGKVQVLSGASEGVFHTDRTQADFATGTLVGAQALTNYTPITTPRPGLWRARFWQGTSVTYTNIPQLYAQTPIYEAQTSTVNYSNYAVPNGTSFDGTSGASQYVVGRWDGHVVPTYSEVYTFTIGYNDYVEVYLNGGLAYTATGTTSSTWTGPYLTAGKQYDVSVVWYNGTGTSAIGLQWQSTSQAIQYVPCATLPVAAYPGYLALSTTPPAGWRYRFWWKTSSNYNVIDTTQAPAVESIVSTINYTSGPPPGGSSSYYNARFDAIVTAQYSEAYTFYVTGDDGVRLYIDGTMVANGWVDQAPTTYTYTTSAWTTGQTHVIAVEYYQNGGGAYVTLEWSSASTTRAIVPSTAVYTTSGTRISASLSLAPAVIIGGSSIAWTATTPGASTATLCTSVDGGTTWSNAVNGSAIPGLTVGASASGATVLVRQALAQNSATSSPTLAQISVRVNAGSVSYHNDGSVSTTEVQELQPYRMAVIADAPLFYWRMHERTSPPYVADVSGNANRGSLPNPSWLTFQSSAPITEVGATSLAVNQPTPSGGTVNTAVLGAVTPPTSVSGSSTNFTFECWVKVPSQTISLFAASNSGTAGTSGQMFVWQPIQGSTVGGAGLSVGTNGVQVFELASGYMPCLASYSYPSTNTAWTHIVVVYNAQVPTIYVNGSFVTTGVISGKATSACPVTLGSPYGYAPVYNVADCAVYSTALSGTRIMAHYQAGVTALAKKWSYKGASNQLRFLVPNYLEENSAF
jgi:hypothetical protein